MVIVVPPFLENSVVSNSVEFRVLIVDDNPAIHRDFRKILTRLDDCGELDQLEQQLYGGPANENSGLPNFEVDSAYQGLEGVAKVAAADQAKRPYSLAFVDMRIPPGISGIETIERMWAIAPDLQIVVCTAFADMSWGEIVTRLGWSDRLLILKKPFDKIEVCQMALSLSVKHQLEKMARLKTEELRSMVAQRTIELEKEIQQRRQIEAMLRENPNQFYEDSEVDRTTGLLNRHAILDRINFIASDAEQHDDVYSILYVDVDGMQDVNAAFGHLAGDLALKNVAQRLRETLRPNDVIGRYGGEEFIICLRHCSQDRAVMVAERLRARVAESTVMVDGSPLKITVSVGVATQVAAHHTVAERVLECADEALGLAKIRGRNRVETKELVKF